MGETKKPHLAPWFTQAGRPMHANKYKAYMILYLFDTIKIQILWRYHADLCREIFYLIQRTPALYDSYLLNEKYDMNQIRWWSLFIYIIHFNIAYSIWDSKLPTHWHSPWDQVGTILDCNTADERLLGSGCETTCHWNWRKKWHKIVSSLFYKRPLPNCIERTLILIVLLINM